MKQFEAKSLEEAYELATSYFTCSIVELDIDFLHKGSKGFFGFFKRNVIINVTCRKQNKKKRHSTRYKVHKTSINIKDIDTNISNTNTVSPKAHTNQLETQKVTVPNIASKEEIFDKFYHENDVYIDTAPLLINDDSNGSLIINVRATINILFSNICYNLDEVKVEFYDKDTLYIEFNGKDSALLIGKEGYRYKALSYILFNWINKEYGLNVRLEIAQFLKNQEESIYKYLKPVIQSIKENGTFKTKPLDGILIHIALEKLRQEFPNKYIAVKTNIKGDKYILINQYMKKQK